MEESTAWNDSKKDKSEISRMTAKKGIRAREINHRQPDQEIEER